MTLVKSIAVVLCLFGTAINPAVSRVLPCCCSQEEKRPCCHTSHKSTEPLTGGKSCCKKKAAPARRVVVESGCCCIKQLPPSVPASNIKFIVQQPSTDIAAWPPVVDQFSDSITYLRDCSHEFRPSGPPLLALNCTWLK